MKTKILICAAVAGCLLGCAKTTTQTLNGTVCSCTSTEIIVLEQDKQHYDIIQLTGTTIVKPPMSPPCMAGAPVQVTYNPSDAQRKESPAGGGCPTSPAG